MLFLQQYAASFAAQPHRGLSLSLWPGIPQVSSFGVQMSSWEQFKDMPVHGALTEHCIFFLQHFATFLQPPNNFFPNPL